MFLFLVLCIDYQGLINIRTNEENIADYINLGNLGNTNFFLYSVYGFYGNLHSN